MTAKKGFIYVLIAYVIFVFVQSLFFKFTGSEETDIIFSTIAQWMNDVGLSAIAPTFDSIGGYLIGSVELIAAVLLLIPATRKLGALLGLGVISGAIFFHLATPLGVHRVINAAGETDGGVLFYMACGVWLSCLLILILSKSNKRRGYQKY
ncbi:MAG: DoxX family membrane protein [Arenicella sp.]|nr:DoxX family membrane protein [Arenicella sp.]